MRSLRFDRNVGIHMRNIVLPVLALLLLSTNSAHAYLDPGTGSIILQAIVAGVASSLFVLKMYWHKFKSLIGLSSSASKADSEND
jgi:multisubunit Na+/H+ antiporter MnhC subunit